MNNSPSSMDLLNSVALLKKWSIDVPKIIEQFKYQFREINHDDAIAKIENEGCYFDCSSCIFDRSMIFQWKHGDALCAHDDMSHAIRVEIYLAVEMLVKTDQS